MSSHQSTMEEVRAVFEDAEQQQFESRTDLFISGNHE